MRKIPMRRMNGRAIALATILLIVVTIFGAGCLGASVSVLSGENQCGHLMVTCRGQYQQWTDNKGVTRCSCSEPRE